MELIKLSLQYWLGNMNLSPHFTKAEAEKSHTAIRLGINNTLSEEHERNARNVAVHILEPCRRHFDKPFSPNSWYRGEELNKAVRGSKRSQHCTASAVDIEIPGVSNMELAQFIVENCEFDQLILEFYDGVNPASGWVHVSYAQNNRGEVLRTANGKQYEKGLW